MVTLGIVKLHVTLGIVTQGSRYPGHREPPKTLSNATPVFLVRLQALNSMPDVTLGLGRYPDVTPDVTKRCSRINALKTSNANATLGIGRALGIDRLRIAQGAGNIRYPRHCGQAKVWACCRALQSRTGALSIPYVADSAYVQRGWAKPIAGRLPSTHQDLWIQLQQMALGPH